MVYRKVGQIRSPAALAGRLLIVVHRLCMLPVPIVTRGVEELRAVEEGWHFARTTTSESILLGQSSH